VSTWSRVRFTAEATGAVVFFCWAIRRCTRDCDSAMSSVGSGSGGLTSSMLSSSSSSSGCWKSAGIREDRRGLVVVAVPGSGAGVGVVGAGDGALRDLELRVGVPRAAGGAGLLVFCRVLLVEPGAERSCIAPLTPVAAGALVGFSGASFLTLLFDADDLCALPLIDSAGVL
jgi:hypothetical protein